MPVFSLNLPFAEQIEFFRRKENLPTQKWDDILHEAHDRSFVVAGAMSADLLNELRKAVEKGIADGTDLAEFRKDFQGIVEHLGWHGWTGEDTVAGQEWRTRIIFETNLAASYAAGRYAQLTDPDLLKRMPYWRYVHDDMVLNPRKQHEAWDGLVLHHTHPFWETNYPPNGWGCHCTVEAATGPGKADKTEPPAGWNTPDENGKLPGIDRGWAYAPGKSVAADLRNIVATKAAKLPEEIAALFTKAMQHITAPKTVEEFIAAGKTITDELAAETADLKELHTRLMERLQKETGAGKAEAKVLPRVPPGGHKTLDVSADRVRTASRRYPKEWVEKANALGPLSAMRDPKGRGWSYSNVPPVKKTITLRPPFGRVKVEKNEGYMALRTDLGNAIHEYAHRLQAAMPELQELFAELHTRRTTKDGKREALQKLQTLLPGWGYEAHEESRPDNYIDAYWGREYNGKPLEVMTKGMETVLAGYETKKTGNDFKKLYNDDREMFDFVTGVLFHWKPIP
jgi:hypothetical protein